MRVLIIVGCLLLSGCVQVQPARPEPNYLPAYPEPVPVEPMSHGGLLPTGGGFALFEDRKALQVGDLLTINLEEQMRSSKSAETSLSKQTSKELPNPRVFGNLVRGAGPDTLFQSIDDSTSFTGGAESDQSNSLSGTITAVIAKVLPNGLMLVQGEKWLQLNRGEEFVRVSGLVRPEDVDGGNTVSSLRLADARIVYSGTGELADSNKAGWLTRFFLNPLFPL